MPQGSLKKSTSSAGKVKKQPNNAYVHIYIYIFIYSSFHLLKLTKFIIIISIFFKNLTFSPKKAAPKKLAPKRKAAIKNAQITKRHTAALTGATEKLLASKIGHLELLKGTRKEIEQKNNNNNKSDASKKLRTTTDRGGSKS